MPSDNTMMARRDLVTGPNCSREARNSASLKRVNIPGSMRFRARWNWKRLLVQSCKSCTRSSNLIRLRRSFSASRAANPCAARRKSSRLLATDDEASTMRTTSTGTCRSSRSLSGCRLLSSKTRKSLRVRSFTSRPFESRTVTGNMTSVVSTETTSPGLSSGSFSGCFLRDGTGGGAPIVSSEDGCGAGDAAGFGFGVVR